MRQFYLLSVFIALLITTSGLTPASVHAQSRRTERDLPKPGRLVLVNTGRDSVKVEVRSGSSPLCEKNPLVGVRTVPPLQEWAISSLDHICWRYPWAPTRGASTQSPWTHRMLVRGSEQSDEI